MPDSYLTWSDGVVILGDLILPGLLRSHSISAGVRYDKAFRDHESGKNKTPLGWEDADVKLELDLCCDEDGTCYDKLRVIDEAFKGTTKQAAPRVYTVCGSHINARGINRVVFSGLDSAETDEDDVIKATLSFSEHIPKVVKKEKQVNRAAAAPAAKAKPAPAPAVQTDDANPFMAGFFGGLK